MPPKQRPDLLQVGLGDGQGRNFVRGEKRKIALAMRRRDRRQARQDFEQKQQPMPLPFIAVLADDPCQMQIARGQAQADFLARFAAGAGVGGFALVHVQLAAAGTPQAQVRLLRPLH